MPDTHNTKNFMAHGGNELVIGGKLTFLEGAEITGLTDAIEKAENIPDSTASTIATLKDDFNALLAALKAAGFMEADEEPEPEEDGGDGDEDDDEDDEDDEDGGGSGESGGPEA